MLITDEKSVKLLVNVINKIIKRKKRYYGNDN